MGEWDWSQRDALAKAVTKIADAAMIFAKSFERLVDDEVDD